MLAQDVINNTSNDIRQVLGTSAPDALIFLPWIDQVQKDVLYSSLYAPYNQSVQSIQTSVNQSLYALPNPVRRILLAYDRTFDHVLTPMDGLGFPTQKADSTITQQAPMPESMLSATTSVEWPSFYRRTGDQSLYIFPAPQKNPFLSTIEIHYESYPANVTSLSQLLQVPDGAFDVMTLGVNARACQYLKLPTEAQAWMAAYQAAKNAIPEN